MNVIAYLVFLLMVILIGKGYTVTRGKLRLHTEILITVFMAVYTVAILLLYLVEFTVSCKLCFTRYNFTHCLGDVVVTSIQGCIFKSLAMAIKGNIDTCF